MATLQTDQGPARVTLDEPEEAAGPRGALILGHGAGGGIDAPDLRAAAAAARALGLRVALVEQPYRVAGRRAPAPAPALDAAWLSVLGQLQAGPLAGLPIVCGGRSSGARVACRTAAAGAMAGLAGVLCLAFPLHPPGRPEKTRLGELESVGVPVLVVQGARDPFGLPPTGPGREVVVVPGTHTLRAGGAVRDAVGAWLARRLPSRSDGP